jgi:hypothetical protein
MARPHTHDINTKNLPATDKFNPALVSHRENKIVYVIEGDVMKTKY